MNQPWSAITAATNFKSDAQRTATPSGVAASTSVVMPATASRDFVDRGSIVRRIWGDPDLVLLIFAGSAAEFALNRAVDWLFFTGKIPPRYWGDVRSFDRIGR